jgi:hypothetical protein
MSAAAAQGVPAAPGVRRYSREDIVRLGQAGRPWEFLPVASQALEMAPEDAGLRVLAAANLAKLGLATAAREHLERLPEAVARDGSLAGLWGAVRGLPQDRIAPEALMATARANVEALLARGVDLREEFSRWNGAAEWEWFRAADGNVVRRRDGRWRGLGDHKGAAAAFAREHLDTAGARLPVLTLEGIDPPWVLQEIASRASRGADSYWPLLIVVQADAAEFLDGLAQAELGAVA